MVIGSNTDPGDIGITTTATTTNSDDNSMMGSKWLSIAVIAVILLWVMN
jgi:hypothetical protein